MRARKLPINAGEKIYYPLSDIYSASLTIVSYLSSDPNAGGKYKDLFSPSYVSVSEKNGLFDLVSKFLIANFAEHEIFLKNDIPLEEKINFLADEGYFVAPIFKNGTEKKYSATFKRGYEEVGGLITSRGFEKKQAEMFVKELNGEPFVFNVLYQSTREAPYDLSRPLYAVIDIQEVKEAAAQVELTESKKLARMDWHMLSKMSLECKKNCWLDAVSQDARAFSLAPDDIKCNQWSIIAAAKKVKNPEVILSCAKEGEGLLKACDMLLRTKVITFEQIPVKLQEHKSFDRYKVAKEVKPWQPASNYDNKNPRTREFGQSVSI